MKKTTIWATWVGLILFALVLRIVAAKNSSPLAGDAWHFVQYGVALANGVPSALSTYWSQGMIALAAGAVKLGLDPRYVLQATTLVSGVLQVGLFAWLVWLLTGSHKFSIVGGAVLAANPKMTYYAVTGYSEMPYMMLLTAGLVFGVLGIKRRQWFLGVAGLLIGASGYFKGLDAAVAASAFGLFVMWSCEGTIRKKISMGVVVPAVAFVVLVPLCSYTFVNTGSFTPGSKGKGNLAIGADWSDSKVVYSAQGRTWEEVPAADLFRQMPSRIKRNMADTFRLFNNQIFTRGFRMGTMWFALLWAASVAILWMHRVRASILPAGMLIMQLGLLWLVFVHDRLLMPSLPWMILVFLLAWHGRFALKSGWKHAVLPGLVLVLYLAVNSRYSIDSLSREDFLKTVACAESLRAHGGTDQDVVMSYGPALAVEFNRTNPLRTVEVPYGTMEQVEEIANRGNVRFVVLSDTKRPHWPVARLFEEGVVAPTNWVLLDELDYREELWPGGTRVGERLRIYERMS